jgi:hypothetical protein
MSFDSAVVGVTSIALIVFKQFKDHTFLDLSPAMVLQLAAQCSYLALDHQLD